MDDIVRMPGHFSLPVPSKRSLDDDHGGGLDTGQRKVRLIDVQPRNIQDLRDEVRAQYVYA